MAGNTPNYGLETLNGSSGDSFGLSGWKYTQSDRRVIDALLYLGAETHHHTGISRVANNPASAPTVALSTTGGTLPASSTVYYVQTNVDPNGLESAPSPVASVNTPAQVATPGTPSGVFSSAAGTLSPGNFYYIISAYQTSSTVETLPSLAAAIAVPSTGEVNLTFPTLPSGATGYNIYKMAPGSVQYLFLASTTSTTYTDNGSVAVNCNRTLPTSNSTSATASVVVTRTATLPVGYTWNLYRTFTSGSWGATQIASGQTGSTFTDTGQTAASYTPPTQSQIPGTPSKVLLTNGAEVQGTLPGSMVAFGNSFPFSVDFIFPGTLSPTTGVTVWTCPFASATIISAQCSLGRGSVPASQNVIADVLLGVNAATPTYSSIYSGATPNPKPHVPVGLQIGTAAPPNVTAITQGESLSADIDQAGGGATPTDHDLRVTVYMLVNNGSPAGGAYNVWTYVTTNLASLTAVGADWIIGSPPSSTSVIYLPANPNVNEPPVRVEIFNNSTNTTSYTVKTDDGATITFDGAAITGTVGFNMAEEGEIRDFNWDATDMTWRVS